MTTRREGMQLRGGGPPAVERSPPPRLPSSPAVPCWPAHTVWTCELTPTPSPTTQRLPSQAVALNALIAVRRSASSAGLCRPRRSHSLGCAAPAPARPPLVLPASLCNSAHGCVPAALPGRRHTAAPTATCPLPPWPPCWAPQPSHRQCRNSGPPRRAPSPDSPRPSGPQRLSARQLCCRPAGCSKPHGAGVSVRFGGTAEAVQPRTRAPSDSPLLPALHGPLAASPEHCAGCAGPI